MATQNTKNNNERSRTASTTDSSHKHDTAIKRRFVCPHCAASYSDERLTRVHITRADDSAHENRHGLMPEEAIEVHDADGTVLETISRHPSDIELEGVTVETFPADISEKRRHALVVATQNPEVGSRRELTRLTRERLAGEATTVEPPCERTVGRALDAFYQPAEPDPTEQKPTPADLTPTQQAIWIARAVFPDESNAGLADIVGCAHSYPGQLIRGEPHLFTDLEERLEAGVSPETIVTEELDSGALETLQETELLSDVPVDLEALITKLEDAESSKSDEESGAAADNATDETAETTPQTDSQWGQPTATHNVMRAAPSDPITPKAMDQATAGGTQRTLSADDSQTETKTEASDPATTAATTADETSVDPANPERTATEETQRKDDGGEDAVRHDEQSASLENETADSTAVGTSSAGIDRETELEALQAKVAFFRQTISPVTEPDGPTALLESFAEQVEQHCEAIRRTENQS